MNLTTYLNSFTLRLSPSLACFLELILARLLPFVESFIQRRSERGREKFKFSIQHVVVYIYSITLWHNWIQT